MNTNDPQKLEAAVHRVLRGLPERKAPAGLEGRVLAELARRAALPWWRKSFAHWPAAIRAGFFAGSVLAAALVVSGLIYLSESSGAHELSSGIASSVGWLVLVPIRRRMNPAATRTITLRRRRSRRLEGWRHQYSRRCHPSRRGLRPLLRMIRELRITPQRDGFRLVTTTGPSSSARASR